MPEKPGGQSYPLVHSLVQDRLGFIWIAGPYGLARYDGHSFLFFQHQADDPRSLSDDLLFNVFEDSRGDLWVTSDKGLNLLDRKKGGFVHFRHDPADPRTLSSDRIRAICEDAAGFLWVGTADGGLNRLDPKTLVFTRFLHRPADPNSPGSDAIWALCRDGEGRIWMGATDAGLDCYDPASGAWTHYPATNGESDGLGDRHYWDLLAGRDGRIWVGTNARGLYGLDPSTGKFSRVRIRERADGRRDARILALHEDRDGILWIGTEKAGLFRLDPKTRALDRFTAAPDDSGGLSDNAILSIAEDREGLLWFGTGRGVSSLNKKRARFAVLRAGAASEEGLPGGDVLSLCEDRDGFLWVGAAKGGISRWERKNGLWTRTSSDPAWRDALGKVRVQAIAADGQGDLWIGTGEGLCRIVRKTKAFVKYSNSALKPSVVPDGDITALLWGGAGHIWVGTRNRGVFEWDVAGEKVRDRPALAEAGLSNAKVNALCLERSGRLWIGTQWTGIFRFDPATGVLSEFGYRQNDPTALASATVFAIAEDRDGRIWAGTQAGACFFETEKEVWTSLADTAGLPSRPVYGIVPDGAGDIWLSSEADLVRFRPNPASAKTYKPDDGLQGGHFNAGAGLRLRSGEIVFGGTSGLNHFSPAEIVDSLYLPPVAVTGVLLSSPAGLIQLLGAPDTLDIPKSRFPATVLLSSLSYSHPERNRYRAREASPEGRVYEMGAQRGLRLETLKPGPHPFVFYAANHDGVWNPEGVALTIRVTVPFWRSWSGRALLAALLAGAAGLWLRGRRRGGERRLLHEIGEDLGPLGENFNLTKREQEILALILRGKTNKEIETALFISSKTVNNHIYNLYQKMKVKSRLGLINAVRDFTARKTRPAAAKEGNS